LRVAQTRQKGYADNRRRPLEFEDGDHVYLKMSPLRGMRRFKVKGRLFPRYIGPFIIFRRVREMAYQLELHDNLSYVHFMCLNLRSVSVSLRNSYQWKSSVFKEI
jgi:hypothetical protein